ncbi:hypothetical protein Pmani_028614 [Petrolisthes manimaculis]|uniref:PBZ-type domain-containing protein n=1 Tax=Petrolisthes manimaculis TaxID=1843537 RepID=A0AAE1TVB5_9EUCA|nr:hypothetical protein Pmani_028614 [Petrolisthes manimaculis]
MEGCSDDESFQNDPRTPCKYGEKCYQKNPQHHKRFKHPPKRKDESDGEEEVKERRKELVRKVDSDSEEEEEEMPSAPKRMRRDENSSSSRDDAIVPEIDTQAEETENSKFTNDKPYVRTRVPKVPSSSEEGGEKSNETAEEEGLGFDYFVPDSPQDVRFSIEQKFLLEMPQDFFDLWDCCKKINAEKPEEALQKAGLTLVGPYDILTGKLKKLKTRRVSSYVCHWRYYHDPPEFMTVIAGDRDEYHIGYFRDDPFQMPNFVASMSSAKAGNIKPLGENIFAGVCSYLTQRMKEENPFKKTPLQRLYKEVEAFAKTKNHPLQAITEDMKKRNKNIVTKSFHGAGIVVPVRNDVGYREIPETSASLRMMFQKVIDAKTEEEKNRKFEDIQELITNVQFAYDEGDYGMGLELGMNMFIYGGEAFHKAIFHLLAVGYDLLGREPYVDIIQAHLKNRRRGSNMSILEMPE